MEEVNHVILIGSFEELQRYANHLKTNNKVSPVKRIILTSNSQNDEAVFKVATALKAKILPQGLFDLIPYVFEENLKPSSKVVDMVWLDDEKIYLDDMVAKYYPDTIVDKYYDPAIFFDYVIQYPLNTKIFLDHNYYSNDNYKFDVNGITVAQKLNQSGYTNLFLISGEAVENAPEYLKVILKTDTQALRNLNKL